MSAPSARTGPRGRAWVALGVSALLAAGTAAGLGAMRGEILDPTPADRLVPGESVVVDGVSYRLDSFGVTELPEGSFAEPAPPGAVWVQAVTTVEVVEPNPPTDVWCEARFESGGQSWASDSAAVDYEAGSALCGVPEGSAVGDTLTYIEMWMVPEEAVTDGVAVVRLMPSGRAWELRPGQ